MKYAVFSFEGNGFPIAKHLLAEGQEVLVGHVEDIQKTLTKKEKSFAITEEIDEKRLRMKRYNHILKKIPADVLVSRLKKVKNPKDWFLFFDTNNLFYYAKQLEGLGFQGNFPTEEDRLFEVDRDLAKDFVAKYYPEVKVASKRAFTKISEAKTFLEETTDIWVLKSQTDDIPTFVPETNSVPMAKRQVLETLDVFQEGYETSGFFLEKKIQNIVEVTPEKYYYNGKPVALSINIENKFLGSGNLSMQVGCAGDFVFPIAMGSKIDRICFPPIIDELAKKHKGFFIWDASLLIDPQTNDIYFGEFCPNRPGYNSIFTEIAQAPSVHEFFENLVAGKNPFTKQVLGVSLMLFNLLRDPEDTLLADASIDIAPEIEKHVWAYDIYKKSSGDSVRTVGYDLHLSPITAIGKTIQEAVDALYKNVEGFAMTRVYYRPKFDYISRDYASSILNRLMYCVEQKLFDFNFR